MTFYREHISTRLDKKKSTTYVGGESVEAASGFVCRIKWDLIFGFGIFRSLLTDDQNSRVYHRLSTLDIWSNLMTHHWSSEFAVSISLPVINYWWLTWTAKLKRRFSPPEIPYTDTTRSRRHHLIVNGSLTFNNSPPTRLSAHRSRPSIFITSSARAILCLRDISRGRRRIAAYLSVSRTYTTYQSELLWKGRHETNRESR